MSKSLAQGSNHSNFNKSDLRESPNRIFNEIANRSHSNNTSTISGSFSKTHNQSFKPHKDTPQILQNIYSHKKKVKDKNQYDLNREEELN